MHVYGPTQIHAPQSISAPHAPRISSYAAPTSANFSDEVQISSVGQLLDRLSDLPEIRAGRVAELRAAIHEGRYDSEERLSVALDRLLDEIG